MNKDIFLTNNLNNKKEKFVPINKENIGMYVCGPTVYDNPHVGNARPLVIFDILFKVLKSKDLIKSKEYLSDIIKEKVTDEQLNLLIDNIDFERKTELIYSGIQMGFNGSMFTLLQYKYSDDSFKRNFFNKNVGFSKIFDRGVFLMFEMTNSHHWLRLWVGTDRAPSHFLKRC